MTTASNRRHYPPQPMHGFRRPSPTQWTPVIWRSQCPSFGTPENFQPPLNPCLLPSGIRFASPVGGARMGSRIRSTHSSSARVDCGNSPCMGLTEPTIRTNPSFWRLSPTRSCGSGTSICRTLSFRFPWNLVRPEPLFRGWECLRIRRSLKVGASSLRLPMSRTLIGWRLRSADVRKEAPDHPKQRTVPLRDPTADFHCWAAQEVGEWVKPGNMLGGPVWSHAGIVCTGEVYKQVVKLTFARGASLADPWGLFNSSLDGSTRRAIDIREGGSLDAEAFKALIRAAVAENLRSIAPKSAARGRTSGGSRSRKKA